MNDHVVNEEVSDTYEHIHRQLSGLKEPPRRPSGWTVKEFVSHVKDDLDEFVRKTEYKRRVAIGEIEDPVFEAEFSAELCEPCWTLLPFRYWMEMFVERKKPLRGGMH